MIRPAEILRRRCLLPAFLGLLLLVAAPAGAATTRIEARGEGFHGVLELAAAPLVTMRPTPFTLTLRDAAGLPTTAPRLTCELVMPAMPMPPNQPQTRAAGDAYRGEAIFTMAGAWQLQVTLHQPGSADIRLDFDIDRVLLK